MSEPLYMQDSYYNNEYSKFDCINISFLELEGEGDINNNNFNENKNIKIQNGHEFIENKTTQFDSNLKDKENKEKFDLDQNLEKNLIQLSLNKKKKEKKEKKKCGRKRRRDRDDKIEHNKYGKCLISQGNNFDQIKIWSFNNNNLFLSFSLFDI